MVAKNSSDIPSSSLCWQRRSRRLEICGWRYRTPEGCRESTVRYSSAVFLPRISLSIPAIGSTSLVPAALSQKWLQSLQVNEVQVYFPKFKINASLTLKQTLMEMGIIQAFSEYLFRVGVGLPGLPRLPRWLMRIFFEGFDPGSE